MSRGTPRTYRYRHQSKGWHIFQVRYRQTDLWIRAAGPFQAEARTAVLSCRHQLENYLRNHPRFLHSRVPLEDDPLAPAIARKMLQASRLAGVGPMAAVAGAIAQDVVERLRAVSPATIVENGGDCFLDVQEDITMGIHCGPTSPFQDRLALRFTADRFPLAICTSSGTIGHSLSLGRADAVTVIAKNAALADAVATALGNLVVTPADTGQALEAGQRIAGVEGILILIEDQLAAWGQVELAPP